MHTCQPIQNTDVWRLTMTFSFNFPGMVVKWMKKKKRKRIQSIVISKLHWISISYSITGVQITHCIPFEFLDVMKIVGVGDEIFDEDTCLHYFMITHFANEWWWTLKTQRADSTVNIRYIQSEIYRKSVR